MLYLTLKQIILWIIIGIIIPLIMFYFIKKKNEKNVKKQNLTKTFIIYYIVVLVFYIGITLAVRLSNSNDGKRSKPIPEPKIETKAEYYYKKGDYQTKYALNPENKNQPYINDQGKWMLNQVGEISEPIIEKKYTFFGFNGLDNCQYPDKVPKDLTPFIREPFNNWYYTGNMKPYDDTLTGRDYDYFTFGQFDIDNLSNEASKLCVKGGSNSFIATNHTIKMDYKGPKYLLEEDQDFYVNEVKCPLQEEKKFETKYKTYYLHFNPKKQYITLYTEKKNTKEK